MGKKCYAVAKGRKPGLYDAWYGPGGAEEQVAGFAGALFRGFASPQEARTWLANPNGAKGLSGNKSAGTAPAPAAGAAPPSDSPAGPSGPPRVAPVTVAPHATAPPRRRPSTRTSASSEPALTPGKVVVYTDGGCRGNPGPGGYGVLIIDGPKRTKLSQGFRLTTNNRMELMACIAAMEAFKSPTEMVLYSDSSYAVNGMTKGWARRWRSNGWMRTKEEPAVNADLWERLLELTALHTVRFMWVRGHVGNPGNERCDELATEAAHGKNLLVDEPYVQGRTKKALGMSGGMDR